MSRRTQTTAAAPPGANAPRQNEYFVPRDGIDREVITADICRYLGNDALVRPGTYLDVCLRSSFLSPWNLTAAAACPRHRCCCCLPPRELTPSLQDAGRTIQGYYITAYRNLTSVRVPPLCSALCVVSSPQPG